MLRNGRAALQDKENTMFRWIVRIIMIVAGVVTGLFLAKDAPLLGFVQTMVMLLLIALVVAALAFWPKGWPLKRSRTR
jgi:uncharacterized membrane protein YoaK (UPF0700 family)